MMRRVGGARAADPPHLCAHHMRAVCTDVSSRQLWEGSHRFLQGKSVSALFTSAARMPTLMRPTARCFHAAVAAGTLRLDMLPVTSALNSIGRGDGSSAVATHASQISHCGSTAASSCAWWRQAEGDEGAWSLEADFIHSITITLT